MKLLVLDVGGTEIKYGTMDDSCVLEDSGSISTPLTGLTDYLDALAGIFEKYADRVNRYAG